MRRIHLLLGVLALGGVALPVSRLWFTRKPAPPAVSVPFESQRRYWQSRIKNDISDVEAYVALGTLEERHGFYIAARRHLLAARALGAPDARICSPLGRALSHLAREEDARVELEKAVALAPDSSEALLNLAGFHIDSRRSREARRLLTEWIGKHPELADTEALERLTLALLTCGEDASADQLARRLVSLAPEQPGALSLAARCAFATGDLARARAHIEKLLPQAPDPVGANFLYGLILQRQKDHDGALTAWQRANALNPSALDLYEKIGTEYARRGDFKRAAFALDQVATADQQYPSVMRAARACEQAGLTFDAAYWDAVGAGLRGDFARALTLGRRAAAAPDPRQRRRGLSAMAEAYRGLKRNADYVRTIEAMTTTETADDLLLRAYAYYQTETQESLARRLDCLRRAAQKDPARQPAIRLQIAEQLRRTGHRDEAEQAMEEGLQQAPENAELLRRLAGFYLDRSDLGDRLARATALSERAVKADPQDEQGWLQLGQCHMLQGNLARAAYCLEHVIDLEPGYGPGYQELGRVYAKMGNAAESQAMNALYGKYVLYEQKHQTLQTRARGPKATTRDILAFGDLLLDAGDFEGATMQYERVFRRQPRDPAVRTTLRLLYERLGRIEQLLALEAAT